MQKSNEEYPLLLIFILLTIFIIPPVSADLSDILDDAKRSFFGRNNIITGMQSASRDTNVSATIASAAPTIGAIYVFSTQAVTIPDQTITENGITNLEVSFNVTDIDGTGEINQETANLTIIRTNFAGGQPAGSNNQSFNTSCVNFANTSSTISAFRCSIEIHYWFQATSWNITAGIRDDSSNNAINTSNFSIDSTTAIVIGPLEIDFGGGLNINDENTTASSPTTVNNTGNAQFLGTATDSVNVTGYDLIGGTESINTGNFTVDIDTSGSPPAECTAATRLVNATTTRIVNSVLLAGNRSGGFGNETIYHCLTIVPSGLSAQTYTTNSSNAWTVSV